MKNKIRNVLLILFASCTLSGCIAEEPDPEQTTIPAVYEGTVSIRGAYLDECYSGIIRLDQDGDKLRVTVIDAKESEFNEWY